MFSRRRVEKEDNKFKIRDKMANHIMAGGITIEAVGEEDQLRTEQEIMTSVLLVAIFARRTIMIAKSVGSDNAPIVKILTIK